MPKHAPGLASRKHRQATVVKTPLAAGNFVCRILSPLCFPAEQNGLRILGQLRAALLLLAFRPLGSDVVADELRSGSTKRIGYPQLPSRGTE